MEEFFDKQSLEKILDVIGKKPSEALRKNEEIWKKQFSSKKIGEKEILKLMIKYPKLIERPIVINKNKGIVGRPPELIKKLF